VVGVSRMLKGGRSQRGKMMMALIVRSANIKSSQISKKTTKKWFSFGRLDVMRDVLGVRKRDAFQKFISRKYSSFSLVKVHEYVPIF